MKSMLARTLPALEGVALSFIFGLSFIFSKEALESLEALELLAHRFSIAALFLLLLKVLGCMGKQPLSIPGLKGSRSLSYLWLKCLSNLNQLNFLKVVGIIIDHVQLIIYRFVIKGLKE